MNTNSGEKLCQFCEEMLDMSLAGPTIANRNQPQLNFECPFCADGKPGHFYIKNPDGLWTCHKCGGSGNLVQLCERLRDDGLLDIKMFTKVVARARSLPHQVARKKVRSVFGKQIIASRPIRQLQPSVPNSDVEIIDAAARYFNRKLTKANRRELLKSFEEETIANFCLGTADPGLSDFLLHDWKFDATRCCDLGLLEKTSGGEFKTRHEGHITVPSFIEGQANNIEYRIPGGKRSLTGMPRVLFNRRALERTAEVYIAEGASDTMKLSELGFHCVGLPSATIFKPEWREYFEKIEKVYVVLDNDNAGRQGRDKVRNALVDKKVINVFLPEEHANIPVNDCRDFFCVAGGTREDFLEQVQKAEETYFSLGEDALPPPLGDSLSEEKEALIAAITRGDEIVGLKTGFAEIDRALDGLDAGLVILVGDTSVGKSTFVNQLAVQIAAWNRKAGVVVYPIEQSQRVMLAKSLARLANVNLRQILRRRQELLKCRSDIERAFARLAEVADRITYVEDHGDVTLDKIRSHIRQAKIRHKTDQIFLVIDSLHALDEALSENQRFGIERAVKELQQIARDENIPLLAVSEIARSQYGRVGLLSGKESGKIDFSANVIISMNSAARKDYLDQTKSSARKVRLDHLEEKFLEAMREAGIPVRQLDLISVRLEKNRDFEAGASVALMFFKAFAKFKEVPFKQIASLDGPSLLGLFANATGLSEQEVKQLCASV